MKLLGRFKISDKVLAIGALILFVLSMYPVLRLALYARIQADDLWYGGYVRNTIKAYGFSFPVLRDGIKWCVTFMWNNWQGTYASAFFMCLVGLWGEKYYFIGIYLVLAIFVTGTFSLVYVLAKHFLKASFYERITLAIVVITTMIQLIYISQQGIYWYNGAAHYTLMHGLLYLTLAGFIKIFFVKKAVSRILLIIFTSISAFISAGSNYSTALTGAIFLLSLQALAFFFKKKRAFLTAPVCLSYLIGFALNILAPGNASRQGIYSSVSKGPVEAVLRSFVSAVTELPKTFEPANLFFLLLAFPIVWKCVKDLDYGFRFPGIVSLYSFCIYAAGITPSWFSIGGTQIERVWVVIKFNLQLLAFINMAYWMGWFAKKKKVKADSQNRHRYNVLFYLIPALGILICFSLTKDKMGNYVSYGSYVYIHTGQAGEFAKEFDARMENIINSEEKDMKVEPLHFRPFFLSMYDDDPNEYASWYGKNSITLIEDNGE